MGHRAQPGENIHKQIRSKSENPERGHVSRAMEPGIRRRPSLSVDRRSATSGTSNTGKPSYDKNRPTGDKNSMNSNENRHGPIQTGSTV